MADPVLREIIGDLVKVLNENPTPLVKNLLEASTARNLKCMRGEALINRCKRLLHLIPVKTTLKMYNSDVFRKCLAVLKIVWIVISKSSHVSSRDAVALLAEIEQLGKLKQNNHIIPLSLYHVKFTSFSLFFNTTEGNTTVNFFRKSIFKLA